MNKDKSIYDNALMIEPMLIWKLPKNKENQLGKLCSSNEYFAQLKKDGFFYMFEKTENKSFLFSRNISEVTGFLTEKSSNVPHIMKALDKLPNNTILVGEIYYPNGTSKDVTPIMGSLPEKAIQRQKDNLIHYYVHDILMYNNVNLVNTKAIDRYKILEKIWEKHNFKEFEFLELAKIVITNIEEEISKALASGEEGMVLKRKNSVYSPGKRPAWDTIKVKKTDTVDVIITGLCEPTMVYTGTELDNWLYWVVVDTTALGEPMVDRSDKGRISLRGPQFKSIPVTKPYFYGIKTAIQIGYLENDGNYKTIGTVSSGLDDAVRLDMTNNPKKYIGSIAEIRCMEKDSNAKTLRHPYFVRIRTDKNIENCKEKDIF